MTTIVRRMITLAASVAVALVAVVPAAAQNADFEDWQRAEFRPILAAVEAAVGGEIEPEAEPFEMATDFLKGVEGSTYVPYTLTIPADRIPDAQSVLMYLRVVPVGAMAAPAEDDDDAEGPRPYEDVYWLDVPSGDGPLVVSRAFTMAGGPHDMYVAVRQSLGADPPDDVDVGPVVMLRERIEVPDFWTNALTISSIILTDGQPEQLFIPLPPEQQALEPYTIGNIRLMPRPDALFARQDELAPFFLVYNQGESSDAPDKPDVTVTYDFYQVTDDGEEYFNKLNPQEFNPQSLPAAFSITQGHQVIAQVMVPLSVFPLGEYRLEVGVADNTNGTKLIRNVPFAVLEEVEVNAVREGRAATAGLPQDVMDTIRRACSERWPDDVVMQRFCQQIQIDAYNELR